MTLDRLRRRVAPWVERARPVAGAATRAVAPVTPLGWTLLVIGLVAWWFGVRLGWEELLVLAAACLVVFVIALVTTIGRLSLTLDASVTPERVVVGGEAVGQVTVSNDRHRPTLGTRVEVPVGANVYGFAVPSLSGQARHDEPFIVPTDRRSIVSIGPARSVKGDPLGIARREVRSGRAVDLYVHPRTVRLPSFSAGWLRDLEGQTTNDLSTSDVAFHTLREYVPGDDRRHIHWRTTARLGTMMVRQFVDTRRSHLGLVLSTTRAEWGSDDEFELGVSAVGSLGRTTLMDDQEVTTISGEHPIASHTPSLLLDGLAGVDLDHSDLSLDDLVHRSTRFLRGVSVLAVVTGSAIDRRRLRAACEHFGHDAPILAIRCEEGVEASRLKIGNVSMIELGALDDLGRVLAVVGAGR